MCAEVGLGCVNAEFCIIKMGENCLARVVWRIGYLCVDMSSMAE